MKTSKRKPAGQNQSVPAFQTPTLPPTPDQIRQRTRDIYIARGSLGKMTLNDWLEAEQELKRKLEG
jgi:hypothetical protein